MHHITTYQQHNTTHHTTLHHNLPQIHYKHYHTPKISNHTTTQHTHHNYINTITTIKQHQTSITIKQSPTMACILPSGVSPSDTIDGPAIPPLLMENAWLLHTNKQTNKQTEKFNIS